MHVPFLLRILASLAVILVVNSTTRRLAPAMFGGMLVLAFSCGFSPIAAGEIGINRLLSVPTLSLLFIVLQVVWFSMQLQKTQVMPDLVAAVRGMTPGRPAFAVLPAVIGLLPMPGGALFSAPLVDECDVNAELPPRLKTQINYWFRHIWEYFWPLYPGVLLAVDFTGLEIWQFMLVQLPLSLLSIAGGTWFLLRRIPDSAVAFGKKKNKQRRQHTLQFLRLVAPVFLVIPVYAGVRLGWPALARMNHYIPMVFGLLAGSVLLQFLRPLSAKDWWNMGIAKRPWIMVALVALVRIYGAFIEVQLPDGLSLVEHVRAEMSTFGIPALAMILLLPFLTGVTTGLAVGFVGASFPIVLSVIGKDAAFGTLCATTVAAYASGYIGMLLSPVHVCLLVTNEHFKTRVSRSLFDLLPVASVVLVSALLYAALVYRLI